MFKLMRPVCSKPVVYGLCVLLGLAAGYVSADLAIAYLQLPGSYQFYGPWRSQPAIGTAQSDPYARARVAVYAPWALPRSEVAYFVAAEDSDGDSLTHRCSYTIAGPHPPVRWWSIAVYRDFKFVPNADDRYSYSATTIEAASPQGFEIVLDRDGSGPNALALGGRPGLFLLLMRVYQPHDGAFVDGRPTFSLPEIEKRSCDN